MRLHLAAAHARLCPDLSGVSKEVDDGHDYPLYE
jgi:hypothetical protein